jgi:hypothetical protein
MIGVDVHKIRSFFEFFNRLKKIKITLACLSGTR